jgi:hypothetical protein
MPRREQTRGIDCRSHHILSNYLTKCPLNPGSFVLSGFLPEIRLVVKFPIHMADINH